MILVCLKFTLKLSVLYCDLLNLDKPTLRETRSSEFPKETGNPKFDPQAPYSLWAARGHMRGSAPPYLFSTLPGLWPATPRTASGPSPSLGRVSG